MPNNHWSQLHQMYMDYPLVDKFLDEIESVCRKHGLSISHEDEHGAFVIEPIADIYITWLRSCLVNDKPKS